MIQLASSFLKRISRVKRRVGWGFCCRFQCVMRPCNSGDGTLTESIACCQRLERRSVFSFYSDIPFLSSGQSGWSSHLLSLFDGSDAAFGCSGSDQIAFDVSEASKDTHPCSSAIFVRSRKHFSKVGFSGRSQSDLKASSAPSSQPAYFLRLPLRLGRT